MKKYILISLLIILIVPSIALASWWNPFSWFNGWNFNKIETTTDYSTQKITVPNITTTNDISNKVIIPPAPIKPNTLPVAEKTTPQKDTTQPKQVPQVVPSVVTSPQQPIVSGCTSIQGYSASTGISCSGDNSCINGSFFDKNTGSCINYLTYCQKQNGSNASYDSINNNCVCKTGYVINSAGTGCQIPTPNPKLVALQSQLQMYQNELASGQAEIQKYQNQLDSQNCSTFDFGATQGQQASQQLAKSQICLSIQQAISQILQQDTPIVNQISYIKQEISNLGY